MTRCRNQGEAICNRPLICRGIPSRALLVTCDEGEEHQGAAVSEPPFKMRGLKSRTYF